MRKNTNDEHTPVRLQFVHTIGTRCVVEITPKRQRHQEILRVCVCKALSRHRVIRGTSYLAVKGKERWVRTGKPSIYFSARLISEREACYRSAGQQ